MPRHEIVVSTENTHYLVWQAMLFHVSCVTHLGRPPIVMVHMQDEPLLPGFERIRAAGGIVQTAPNYRFVNGVYYPPRNTAASLRHVQTDADYIVLCDPDMLFLQPLPFDELSLFPRQISFDFIGYLDPDIPIYQPTIDDVCRAAGIAPEKLRQPVIDGGVPHVIPTQSQKPLSDEWLELIELFPNIHTDSVPQKDWLATMWALVMAMHRLKLEPVMTKLCVTNHAGDSPLPPIDESGPSLIHYCYGAPGFNKRLFDQSHHADDAVWNAAPDDGSVSGAIRNQIRLASDFFGLMTASRVS